MASRADLWFGTRNLQLRSEASLRGKPHFNAGNLHHHWYFTGTKTTEIYAHTALQVRGAHEA
jgi:hypothetical protein